MKCNINYAQIQPPIPNPQTLVIPRLIVLTCVWVSIHFTCLFLQFNYNSFSVIISVERTWVLDLWARDAGDFIVFFWSLILITMTMVEGNRAIAQFRAPTPPTEDFRDWKMHAIKQIKICAEYRDMVPRPRLDSSDTPEVSGDRPRFLTN